MIDLDEKLVKIVELAKHGVGGEKQVAMRMVERKCRELGLDPADVMSGVNVKEYTIPYKGKAEHDIISQICWKFAVIQEYPNLWWRKYEKVFIIKTTAEKYLETMNAITLYMKAYRQERRLLIRNLPMAFVSKHQIYSEIGSENTKTKWSAREIRDYELRQALAANMQDVKISKGIQAKND